jgi:hypothetical protein
MLVRNQLLEKSSVAMGWHCSRQKSLPNPELRSLITDIGQAL